ncbi:hypothetical protein A0J61_03760 [Choanephora cucurbitarum]|uniref:Uncharacterized protein n=1 Tax=Choanephora cucurbitarum TaxID=101091 RepID=A0A1C7NI40_9FUNG|nr:hypothetical protein A0J61_03760 [Choanephora cucurbitarum]
MSHVQRIIRIISLKRAYSTVSEASSEKKLVYTSPQIGLVKFVKRFSLSTLGISSISTPAIMYFWDSAAAQTMDVSNTMFLGAMMASVCSTGALSFLLSPYVNSIHLHMQHRQNSERQPPISPNTIISIETLDLLARKRTSTLQLKDLLPIANSSLLTWNVNKKALEKQYLLEQMKGIEPKIKQHRFWLDQRNGMGDKDVMSSILRVVQEQGRKKMI